MCSWKCWMFWKPKNLNEFQKPLRHVCWWQVLWELFSIWRVHMQPPCPWHIKGFPKMYLCSLALFLCSYPKCLAMWPQHRVHYAKSRFVLFCYSSVAFLQLLYKSPSKGLLICIIYFSALVTKLLCFKQTEPCWFWFGCPLFFPTTRVMFTENFILFDSSAIKVFAKNEIDYLASVRGDLIWREGDWPGAQVLEWVTVTFVLTACEEEKCCQRYFIDLQGRKMTWGSALLL